MKTMTAIAVALGAALTAASASAATEISFWHAMGGRLCEIVDEFTVKYNASQDGCVLTSTYKGNYTETMTSAIAAFRAKPVLLPADRPAAFGRRFSQAQRFT